MELIALFFIIFFYAKLKGLIRDLEEKSTNLEKGIELQDKALSRLGMDLREAARKINALEKGAKAVSPPVDSVPKKEVALSKIQDKPIETPVEPKIVVTLPPILVKPESVVSLPPIPLEAGPAASLPSIPQEIQGGLPDVPPSSTLDETSDAADERKTDEELEGKPGAVPEEPRETDRETDFGDPEWVRKWRQFKDNVDWEQFAGTKLFAWLGGIALFVGAGLFVKYSIDKDLIPPMVRLVIGAVIGLGLILASSRFDRERYDILRQSFAAGGIGVLYSVFFAATLYYEYLPKTLGFACLTAVSATAFVLAVYHRGISISVLAGIGAYSTPMLVTTGEGSLISLVFYLSVVNVGFYQVMKRLEADGLQLFATAGTLISLALATVFSSPSPQGFEIALAWAGNLVLFSFFLDFIKPEPQKETNPPDGVNIPQVPGIAPQDLRHPGLLGGMHPIVGIAHVFGVCDSWAGHLLYISLLLVAWLVTIGRAGSGPMLMLTVGTIAGLTLALRNREWYSRVVPFSVLAFIVAMFWALMRFDGAEVPLSYLLFLLYGVAGGVGPILLIKKYGPDASFVSWFKTFPVAIAGMSIIAVFQNPHLSFWFWPMTMGLQIVGIIVSLIFGGIIQLGLLSLFLVIGALFWLTHADPLVFSFGFYSFLLGAGALLCFVIYYALRHLSEWVDALALEKSHATPYPHDGVYAPEKPGMADVFRGHQELPLLTEWMVASPLLGAFLLLAASFLKIQPVNPHPGMATLVCFLVIALTLSKHLDFQQIAIVSLLAAPFSQAFWMLKPEMTQEISFFSMVWSGAFFAGALVLPFPFFASYEKWNKIWMSWAIFEVLQGVFLIFAADHLWKREISGWLPMLLVILKLPVVARLLRQLEGLPQRNAIIACHGGVLLFYFSAVPILLLEKGWLGLTLVFEATALLWLNRRIEHPGLRWVASIMAPVGIFILLSNLSNMIGSDSMIIFNPAVMSTLACVAALFYATRLSSYPEPRLGSVESLPNYFLWLAVGTSFYLINLIIADVFGGASAAIGGGIRFFPEGNLLQAICYMFCWALFGALLWKSKTLPWLMRIAGMGLLIFSTAWLILFPLTYAVEIGRMAPLFNFGFLAYLPIMLVLLFLFIQEPWGEDAYSVKNLFLTMFLIAGFLALKVIKSTILQPGMPFDIFQAKTASMAVGSAAGWLVYGLGLLLWPRRLDRPFRLAGLVLIILGLIKTALFPFAFCDEFGAMSPLVNSPTLLFLFCIAILVYLTVRKPDERWPVPSWEPKPFWGWMCALTVFFVLNVEIASVFGAKDQSFSLLTRGSLAHQLGYSLGWLLYSICLLVVGIKWEIARVRQAALILIVCTSFKIFFGDLWSLGQLYRVASFVGLAMVLTLVSYLYQRYIVQEGKPKNEK